MSDSDVEIRYKEDLSLEWAFTELENFFHLQERWLDGMLDDEGYMSGALKHLFQMEELVPIANTIYRNRNNSTWWQKLYRDHSNFVEHFLHVENLIHRVLPQHGKKVGGDSIANVRRLYFHTLFAEKEEVSAQLERLGIEDHRISMD